MQNKIKEIKDSCERVIQNGYKNLLSPAQIRSAIEWVSDKLDMAYEAGKDSREEKYKSKYHTDIIFYAFRYALGRRTGAVQQVVEYILNEWERIPDHDVVQMVDEIKQAILEGNAGSQSDIREWNRIVERFILIVQNKYE